MIFRHSWLSATVRSHDTSGGLRAYYRTQKDMNTQRGKSWELKHWRQISIQSRKLFPYSPTTWMEDGSSCDSTIKLLLELRSQLCLWKPVFCKRDEESTQILRSLKIHLFKGSARRALRRFLDSLILPKHRAIEIQTSDHRLTIC